LLANWDVVFCRNVTIYFRLESTRRVVNNFYDSLNPGGYLFIGHSETLTSISDRFEPVEVGGVFLYRKPVPRRLFSFDDVVASRAASPVRKPRTRTADLSREQANTGSRSRLKPSETRVARPAPVPPAEPSPAVQDHAEAVRLVAEAHSCLERGEPGVARQFADQALTLDARNVDALLVRAFGYADSGNFSAAIEDASAALAINPLLAPGRYILGVIHLRQGDPTTAANEFKRTLYIDSDFVLAHLNLANIYRQQGHSEDACREYQNTIRALYRAPEGDWTAFLGGFTSDLLVQICERSLLECRKGR
jgi:chemotaxis protein methyltransferase CheR